MVAPISQIEVFSNASVLPNGKISLGVFPVNNNAQRSATLRGENCVKIVFNSGQSIPIPAFAFIEYDGQLFFTKEIYRPEPKGNNVYEYNVKFVSFDNLLSKPHAYRRVVVGSGAEQQTWNEPDIEIVGTLQTIAEVVCESIKASAVRYEGVFADLLSKVEIVSNEVSVNSESKAFSFQGQKISQVLESVANDYKIDYWFEQVGNMTNGITKMVLHFCKYERTDIDPLVLSDKTRVNRLNPYDPASPPNPRKPTVSGGLDECKFANEWSGVVQRITPFGSERNITRQQAILNEMFVSYGKRLRLEYDHSCTIDGTTYQHAYAVKNEEGEPELLYVDENGAVYVPGVTTGEEDIKKYDDIYPRGHFRVTHVTQRGVDTQIFTVYAIPTEERNGQYVDLTDAEIDAMQADPNKRLFPIDIQDGQTLSLHFESGFLNGREFEVANKSAKMVWVDGAGYKVDPDNANAHWIACFEINPEGDNNDSPQVPYGNMVPRGKLDVLGYEGDMFAIFNMDMPPYYKESAMNELAQKAYDEITAILSTRPEVKCRGNEEFFMRQNLCLGLRVKVTSDLFGEGTEFVSRVTNYSHPLSKPNNVDFRLCSSRVQGSISVLKGAIADQTQVVSGVQQTARSLSRRAFRDSQEMARMLQAVVAEMMVVGVERDQFSFTMGIECLESAASPLTRKFSGLRITAGEIQHTQEPYIKDNWEGHYTVDATTLYMDKNNHSIGTNATEEIRNTPYYLYAVIQAETGKANMELWAEKKDGENDEAYLLLGILSSEFLDGTTSLRVFNRSNGFTQIAGGTITTEQLQDPTRQLIIDMSSNPPRIIAKRGAQIIGNITFLSSDGEKHDLEGTLDDMNTKIYQEIDELDERISHISVGGRNLARDTAFSEKAQDINDWTFYNEKNSPTTGKTLNGGSFKTNADDNTVDNKALQVVMKKKAYTVEEEGQQVTKYVTNRIQITQTGAIGCNTDGEYYTFSALVKADTATTLYFGAGYSNLVPHSDSNEYGSASVGESYTRIAITAKVFRTNSNQNYKMFYLRLENGEENTLTFMEAKLERGTLPTSWTQAPEDIEEDIAAQKSALEVVKTDLQKQIDGVVDSYFMEGVPTMDDTKQPLSDWKAEGGGTIDYAKHEGDTYTNIKSYGDELKPAEWEQGRVYIGDGFVGKTLEESKSVSGSDHNKGVRFSRLIQYNAGDSLWVNPGNVARSVLIVYFDNQGKQVTYSSYSGADYPNGVEVVLNKAYSQCNVHIRSTSDITTSIVPALAICINPKAGHSWRFCKGTGENPATWHWHEIADSDAVKALQDAAAAQATADGKMRFFTSTTAHPTPYPPYQVGDMWEVKVDGKSEVKYSTHDRTDSYYASDWVSASEYAETIANAANTLAGQAKDAADDANRKVDNVIEDGIISGGTEKATLKKEWQEIAGDDMSGNTDGSYKKALAVATDYGITTSNEFTALITAYQNLDAAMMEVIGYDLDEDEYDNSNMDKDTYVGAEYEDPTTHVVTEHRYDIDGFPSTSAYYNVDVDRDVFAKLWREYYDAEIALLNKASETIDSHAQSAINQLADMAADDKLTAQEKLEIKREWLEIVEEWTKNRAEAVACGLPETTTSSTPTHIQKLDTAYNALKDYLLGEQDSESESESESESIGIIGHDGAVNDREMDRTTPGSGEEFSRDTFIAKFKAFYNANIDVLNAISTTVKGRADDAIDKANNIANDGIISGGTEKGTLKKEFVEIAGEDYGNNTATPAPTDGSYRKALAQATEYGLSSDAKVTALTSAYTTLRTAMKIVLGTNAGGYIDCSNLNNDTYVGADYDYGGETGIDTRYDITFGGMSYDKDEFIALWKNYYDAEIAVLNAVSDVIDTRDIGGDNLYTGVDPLTLNVNSEVKIDVALTPGKKYVISIVSKTGAGQIKVIQKAGETEYEVGSFQSDAFYSQKYVTFTALVPNLFLRDANDTGAANHTLTQIMVQRGEKPTAYQNSYKYLADAFTHDATKQTTDIDGGLLATSLVLLRNQSNQVRAGISGLDDDGKKIQNGALVVDANSHGVGFFAGGTYAEALAAAAGNGDIPVLLTKDGILSRIGCLQVVDKDTVSVKTDTSKIHVTNKSISSLGINQGNGSESSFIANMRHGSYNYESKSYDFQEVDGRKVLAAVDLGNSGGGKYKITLGNISYSANVLAHGDNVTDASATVYLEDIRLIVLDKNNNVVDRTTIKSSKIIDLNREIQDASDYTDSASGTITANISKEVTVSGGVKVYLAATYAQVAYVAPAAGNAIAYLELGFSLDVLGVEKHTILAKDGLCVITDARHRYKIDNSGSYLKIVPDGLPTRSQAQVGEMYLDGEIVKVKLSNQ